MKFLLVLALFLPCVGIASLIKGNGGNTVVCARSVQLLDLFEGEALRAWHYTRTGIEDRALLRARLYFSSDDFSRIQTWLAEFDHDVQWIENAKLGVVEDSYHFVVPLNCTVEQTVLGRDPLPGEKRYLVQKNIFDRLPNWQQQALRWHETVYRNTIRRRLEKATVATPLDEIYNSETTRRLVAALFADESDFLSADDWKSLIVDFE